MTDPAIVGLVPSNAVDGKGSLRRWLLKKRGSSDRILRHLGQKRRNKLGEVAGQEVVREAIALDGTGGPGAFEKGLGQGGFLNGAVEGREARDR